MKDVIIIGAGPVGLYAAKLLKKKGIDVLIIEEHQDIGKPKKCSGLISKNIESLVPINDSFVDHKVSGAVLHTPAGDINLQKRGTAAYVIDRGLFDQSLAKGLEPLITNARCESISLNSDSVTVKTNKGEFKAKLVFGCDGPNSMVARAIGSKPKELVNGIIAIADQSNTGDMVELWFDKDIAPDGFLWKIPRSKKTEYGMMASKADFKILERFFKTDLSKSERLGGTIPIGPGKSYAERVLLVGDAAAQIKPWSGGGVVYGLTAAKIAANVAAKALKNNDFTERALSEYERQWRDMIGMGINIGLMFREFYKEASNDILKDFFNEMKNRNMNELDMDLLGF